MIPFSPSVYEHAASLLGRSPWEVSRDAELLFAAQRLAWETYRHAPVVVGIDIYNLEAEAYGARVLDPGGNGVPAVTDPPLGSIAQVAELAPFDPHCAGRLPLVLGVARRLRHALPAADVRVPVSGPFAIAVSLRGVGQLLEDVVLRPDQTRDALTHLARNQAVLCRAIADEGLDLTFFESAAAPPLLSPAHFREVELPALKEAMGMAAATLSHPVPCVIGGDTRPILADILATGTGYVICPAETDQAGFVADAAAHPHVKVRINLDPWTVAHGSRDCIRREVERILNLARCRPNCLLGTGALPYETPPENVAFVRSCLTG